MIRVASPGIPAAQLQPISPLSSTRRNFSHSRRAPFTPHTLLSHPGEGAEAGIDKPARSTLPTPYWK